MDNQADGQQQNETGELAPTVAKRHLRIVPENLVREFVGAAHECKDEVSQETLFVLLGIELFGWNGFRKAIQGK